MEIAGAGNRLAARRAGWGALLIAATITGSFVFACATPFPALAALAALHMKQRDAFPLSGVAWVCNQAIGYGFLHYPHTWDSYAWGIAVGIAALIAAAAAIGAGKIAGRAGRIPAILAAFGTAFAAYELALYSATAVLPASEAAFGMPVVVYILQVNAAAFLGLLALQYAGGKLGLAVPRQAEDRIAIA